MTLQLRAKSITIFSLCFKADFEHSGLIFIQDEGIMYMLSALSFKS